MLKTIINNQINMEIKDKVIIVTGASMGIGMAAAKELSKRGAKLVLAARSKDKINALAQELTDSLAIETDMENSESIKNMISETIKKYGRIDVLINNAGRGLYGALENVDPSEYRKIIELNVIGPMIAMQEVIPHMRKQGGGTIVNISSMVSKMYYPHLSAYASTKYALNALSMTSRSELEKDNIIVTLVHPTLTETNFGINAVKSDAASQNMQSRSREGMPAPDSAEDVVALIVQSIETGKDEILAR